MDARCTGFNKFNATCSMKGTVKSLSSESAKSEQAAQAQAK